MTRVAGIILAAGMSRRLGRPKQLLELEGRPLVAHVVARALASRLDEVTVVTGSHKEQIRSALDEFDVRFVHNPHYEQGQGTSIAAGIAALGDDTDAAVILLADQPGISVGVINRVIDARDNAGADVVMARYGDERGHPVLFARTTFPELRALDADIGGREVVRAHRDSLVVVHGDADSPPQDVDTEEAWEALKRTWSR